MAGGRKETGGALTSGKVCCESPGRFAPEEKRQVEFLWNPDVPHEVWGGNFLLLWPVALLPDRQWWWGRGGWRRSGSSRSHRPWGPRTQQSVPNTHTPLGPPLSGRRWKPGRHRGSSKTEVYVYVNLHYLHYSSCVTPPVSPHPCHSTCLTIPVADWAAATAPRPAEWRGSSAGWPRCGVPAGASRWRNGGLWSWQRSCRRRRTCRGPAGTSPGDTGSRGQGIGPWRPTPAEATPKREEGRRNQVLLI